ncbi:MAG: MotA/TolQ/ExbB proton channel family protein [Blastocatellia bacterium]
MKTSSYKKWLYSGIAILAISLVGGLAGALWGISSSFSALEMNETASIGPVGDGIYTALIFNILFVCTGLVGMILLVIGGIKGYRHSRSAE